MLAEESDTVRIIERIVPGQSANPAPDQSQSQAKLVADDFDNRMSVFILEAEAAMASLRNGNASDKEIRNMIFQMVESYYSKYQSLLSDYKSENHDMPGIDVGDGGSKSLRTQQGH